MTAAHAPAINHPTHALAGFSAVHAAAAPSYTSDAVAHGSETAATVASSVRKVLKVIVGQAPLPGWVPCARPGTFCPGSGLTGVPGPIPSYTHNTDGMYTFSGDSGSGTAVSASTLAGAMALWLGQNSGAGTATTTTTTGTTTPFNTLANLLGTIAATPVAADAVPADSPGQSVQTTSAPSPVIPILLVLLAVGVGFWWYTKHKHGKAAAH